MVTNFLHSLVNIFAEGRSLTRVYLLIAYLCLLFLIAWIISKKTPAGRKMDRASGWMFAILATSFLWGIFLFVFFTSSNSLPHQEYLITVNNGELSTTQLQHNHIPKGAFGVIIEKFTGASLENLDAGGAYLGMIPDTFFYIQLGLFIAALLTCISIFRHKIFASGNRQWIFTLLYGLTTFVLLKNIIDGGFFEPRTLVAALFLYLVLRPQANIKKSIIGFSVAYILSISSLTASGTLTHLHEVWNYFSPGATVAIIFSALLYAYRLPKMNRAAWLLIILAAVASFGSMQGYLSLYQYSKMSLAEDGGVIALYEQSNDYTPIEAIGSLNLYSIPKSETKVGNLLHKHDLLDNFFPIAIPWQTCQPKGMPQKFNFTLSSHSKLSEPISFIGVSIIKLQELKSKNGLFVYETEIQIDHCYPRQLNVLEETIKAHGARTFFIYNLAIT